MSQTSSSSVGVGDPYALPIDDVLNQVRSQRDGLKAAEAADRLKTAGPNQLPAPPITTF